MSLTITVTATTPAAKKSVADIDDYKKRVEDSLKSKKALSVDVVKDFTEGLRDIDRAVVEAIGLRKENILKDKELRKLVQEYFDASLQTLEYLNELENCLKVLQNSHLQLALAIKKYDDGNIEACVERLAKFKANGDPFKDKFFSMHAKLRQTQEALLKKVQKMHDEVAEEKRRLAVEEKKKSTWTAWTDIFSIVTASATAVTRICVAVISFFRPPAAVGGGVTIRDGAAAGKRIGVGRGEADKLKTKEGITRSILATTKCVLTELNNINNLVESLEKQIDLISDLADMAQEDTDAVDEVMDDLTQHAEDFRDEIKNLTAHTRKCKEDIFNGRDKVLGFIRRVV